MKNANKLMIIGFSLILMLNMGFAARQAMIGNGSGDPAYENQKIIIAEEGGKSKEVTIGELRKLPQKQMDASYQRTTGLLEKFKVVGPALKDALQYAGFKPEEYKGIGFVGRDGYYCLVTPEIMGKRELILSLVEDGNPVLKNDVYPARLCVQGEFGPYWVRMLNKIVLYKEIPRKDIISVWTFNNLTKDIEPYKYEYYGSKDDSIELAQIFSRFDNVNNKAFFTLKSSDGFKKNEALNMVSKRYYIKVAGVDAPMNISPNIKLGMNVKLIAWFSTNADAAVFPAEMIKLTGEKEINGVKGIALDKMLREVEVTKIENKKFEIIGVDGESVKVSGKDLRKGIVSIDKNGKASVVWEKGAGLKPVGNMLRIRSI